MGAYDDVPSPVTGRARQDLDPAWHVGERQTRNQGWQAWGLHKEPAQDRGAPRLWDGDTAVLCVFTVWQEIDHLLFPSCMRRENSSPFSKQTWFWPSHPLGVREGMDLFWPHREILFNIEKGSECLWAIGFSLGSTEKLQINSIILPGKEKKCKRKDKEAIS